MSLFWLRTPVEAWLGTSAIKAQTKSERAIVARAVLGIAGLAAASIAALLWNGHNRGLLLIGSIAALAFAMQAGVKKLGRKGRMPAQMIGALGLTSTAAGAYYVATGKLDVTAIALWLTNWLFAGNQIHYVQLRIRASHGATMDEKLQQGMAFFAGQILVIGVILEHFSYWCIVKEARNPRTNTRWRRRIPMICGASCWKPMTAETGVCANWPGALV